MYICTNVITMGYFGFQEIEPECKRVETKLHSREIGVVFLLITLKEEYVFVEAVNHENKVSINFCMQTDSRDEHYVFKPTDDIRLKNYYPSIYCLRSKISDIIVGMTGKHTEFYDDIRPND